MPSRIAPDRWKRAESLLRNGESVNEVHRRTGITKGSLRERRNKLRITSMPGEPAAPAGESGTVDGAPGAGGPPSAGKAGGRRRDPAPRARRPAASSPRVSISDEQLESMCRKIAKAPAIPVKLVLHCDYCAMHFRMTAGPMAAELVAQSHEDPDLRGILEALHRNWRRYAWAGLLSAWVGVPMLHHAAPRGVYGAVAPLLGMPPRGQSMNGQPHHHPPAPAPAAAEAEPEPFDTLPVTPFGGLDMDQLIAMAKEFGIELPDDIDPSMLEAMLSGAATVDVDDTVNGNGEQPEPEISAAGDPEPEPAAGDEAPAASPDPDA